MAIEAIDAASVIGSIRLASVRTGVDFDYLLAQARLESGLDPNAAAPTSSARGLYQFTAGTWLDTVRKHGAEHGLAWAAKALQAGATPETREAILALRKDAGISAAMAAALAADNAALLERRIGHAPNATDLYLAHFLGAAGAARFLQARDATPDASAASAVMPAQVSANAVVFTARGGRSRSISEVYERFAAKLGAQAVGVPAIALPGKPVPQPGRQVPVAAPQAARMAYLLLAELGA